jgi:hypothetical protein
MQPQLNPNSTPSQPHVHPLRRTSLAAGAAYCYRILRIAGAPLCSGSDGDCDYDGDGDGDTESSCDLPNPYET